MNILVKHGYLFCSRTVHMTALLVKSRPWHMALAMLLLMSEGALIGIGILLMTYPFASASGGEEAIRVLLDDPNFRWTVAACFAGAVVAFFIGSIAVVFAMSITVATGRISACKVGANLIQLVRSGDIIEMANVDRALIQSGGIEFAMRRSLRTLIRGSFLIPRIVSFALTGAVAFIAIFMIDMWFGLLALFALGVCGVPIYMMNRGVLKRVPEMESAMKRSMVTLGEIFFGKDSGADPFVPGGDLDRSFRLQGYLMTVRYRAGVIKALFLSVCLSLIGLFVFFQEGMNPGVVLALIVALKICSTSLQGIVRMSTGVSRTLRDVTPALHASSPPKVQSVACPAWPLQVMAQDGVMKVSRGDSIKVLATRVTPPLALAMIASRFVDNTGCFLDLSCFKICDEHLCIDDGEGNQVEIKIMSDGDDVALVAKPGAVMMKQSKDSASCIAAVEQEIELELELG
jgi:hypothetical protein